MKHKDENHSMTAEAFRAACVELGLSGKQFKEAAPVFDISPRQAQRFAYDESPVTGPVRKLIALMLKGKVTVREVQKL